MCSAPDLARSLRGQTLRSLIVLAIPTVLEELLATLLQYVDTAMVGHLGEQATAAVSVTTTVTWLVNGISASIGVAVLALISRAVGSGDLRLVGRLAQQALLFTVACGVLVGGVSVALSPYIPVWMNAEEAIRGPASEYFWIVSLPMVFRASSVIFGAALRATKDTKTPMLINLGANLLNAGLNYVLIYPCGLGTTGAAISSAVSYTLAGVLMYAACRRSPLLGWRWREFRPERRLIRECAAMSFPVMGTRMVACLGYVVFAGLVSGMGTAVFAAHSIAVTAETIFYTPGYGLRTATSTLVGISLGEKNRKGFDMTAALSVLLTVGMMTFTGALLYFVSVPLMTVFTESAETVSLGAEMLRLVALSEPFFGLMIVLEGIFYGLGRTRYALFVETFSMWGIRILFTFLCVRVWGLGLRCVWYCMIADNVSKAILFSVPFWTRKGRDRLMREPAAKAPDPADGAAR